MKRKSFLFALFCLTAFFIFYPRSVLAVLPVIESVSDNRGDYASNLIPKYEKLELTASVTTSATNLFFPYDPMTTPVPGISGGSGVSVDGLFLSPGESDWSKAFRQPGFNFIEYDEQNNGGSLWLNPTGRNYWKVRFAPPACPGNDYPCNWQYRLTVTDKGGNSQSNPVSFSVTDSQNHGFIKVSKKDPRYFEFSDGTYFPGMAVNDYLDPANPMNNNAKLQNYGTNGIQVFRLWFDRMGIWGSAWTPWESIKNTYEGYLPRTGIITNQAQSTTSNPAAMLSLVYSESGGQQNLGSWFDACHISVSSGGQIKFPTKAGSTYRIKIRYKSDGLTGGPRVEDLTKFPAKDNYGFVLKGQNPNDGNWHGFQTTPDKYCWNYASDNAKSGVRMTPYGHESANWTNLESDWVASGTTTPLLYLALENAKDNSGTGGTKPAVFIDSIEIREKLAGGALGPNIVNRSNWSMLETIADRNAYAFDKILELAKNNGVYLKMVLLDKNEQLESELDPVTGGKALFNVNNFFGKWRISSAGRWLQSAYFRYMQARYGYSTAIHSWELTNEGDVNNGNHYSFADELGKEMHCLVFGITKDSLGVDLRNPPADGRYCNFSHPNSHLVTTSFWYGFEKNAFWDNRVAPPPNPDPNLTYGSWYPNVDYADVHDYINKPSEREHFYDTALATFDLGKAYGAKQPGGADKPVIRGETALIEDDGTDKTASNLDSKGVWLHNFIWGGINPYGLTEAWWHLGQIGNKWPLYKPYYDFIKNIPLNNGNYADAVAVSSDSNVRTWGQKDTVNKRAHVWVQNKKHIWCAVAGGMSDCPVSWDNSRLNGTVTISGFLANANYPVEWWSFDNNVALTKTSANVSSNGSGQIVLDLSVLPSTVVDTGVKIGDYSQSVNTVQVGNGETNGNSPVNNLDIRTVLSNWLKVAGLMPGMGVDQFGDNKVNGFDFAVVVKALGF